jgi:hypothetical protein
LPVFAPPVSSFFPADSLVHWHGAEPVKRVAIVALGFPDDRELEVVDEGVVLVDRYQVHLDALTDARIGEVVDDAVAIPRVRQALLERGQVVLRARVLKTAILCESIFARGTESSRSCVAHGRRSKVLD